MATLLYPQFYKLWPERRRFPGLYARSHRYRRFHKRLLLLYGWWQSSCSYSVYRVIRPLSAEEAADRHITGQDSCSVPPHFSVEYGYRGYFDFNTGLSVMNQANVEKIPVGMNIVYDPANQTPDPLRLQFCYHPHIPDNWTKTYFDYGSASCDISSLATLIQWSDSVTIVVETGEEVRHLTKISKNDFLKPRRKAE